MVDLHHADGAVIRVPYGPYKGLWRVLPGMHYGSASPRGAKEAEFINDGSESDGDDSPACQWDRGAPAARRDA
jgi:hypothetical protein